MASWDLFDTVEWLLRECEEGHYQLAVLCRASEVSIADG